MSIFPDRDRWPFRTRSKIAVSLVISGALGFMVLAGSVCDWLQTNFAAESVAGPRTAHRSRYLRMDGWLADARTLAAAVRYIFEDEPEPKPSTNFPYMEVAMPTNSPFGLPKS